MRLDVERRAVYPVEDSWPTVRYLHPVGTDTTKPSCHQTNLPCSGLEQQGMGNMLS